jgi:hypothetical protein
MKQHIIDEQFYSLTNKAQRRAYSWLDSKGYLDDPENYEQYLFSIGQMIEFLAEQYKSQWVLEISVRKDKTMIGTHPPEGDWTTYLSNDKDYRELCDALWQAVKEILND